MKMTDEFSTYVGELLTCSYDGVDRVVLNGYFPYGQQGGGMRMWWRALQGNDEGLCEEALKEIAGNFSRRLHAYAGKHHILVLRCAETGQKPFEVAREHHPKDPDFEGLYLVLITNAPALVWRVKKCSKGAPHLERRKPWPPVQHYHFHIQDREWGHVTIRRSGYPPFGIPVIVNGHEWVQRQAMRERVRFQKVDNGFVDGRIERIDPLAETLRQPSAIGRLADLADRWVYSSCLCFGLSREEQERTGFRYEYSCSQMEFSRNLLFRSADQLDEVYQGMIDRTRKTLDVPKLKTLFGRRNRPPCKQGGKRLERILDRSHWDLTVFKLHFGRLTLKMYDKGERGLRVEAIADNIEDLKCGKRLEKLLTMLDKLEQMTVHFLNVAQAAHLSFLDVGALDQLPQPTQRGKTRVAGVDIQKPRMRAVLEAVLPLASAPEGFTAEALAERIRQQQGPDQADYTTRRAAYDLRKLRGKALGEKTNRSRRYQVPTSAFRTIAALIIIREKVLKPVLAGACKPKRGRPPKSMDPLDVHYVNLQRELSRTFQTLGVAA
jgi:hypothetical protein